MRGISAGVSAGLLLLGLASPSLASSGGGGRDAAPHPAPRPRSPVPNQPGDHAMGSQIRMHEGVAIAQAKIDASDIGVEATVRGIDVSAHQGNVNWMSWRRQGKRFAWVKATEGTGYTNPYFAGQYKYSRKRGFIRGAYHFALPNESSGAAQAKFFGKHGGGWSSDGTTLPGALDMEYNPYGATCYGLSKSAMAGWIRGFSRTYHARWHKWPAIYTSTSWWSQCVSGDFHRTNPLWVARYSSSPGSLPFHWGTWTVWQYSSSPIDQDVINGSQKRLKALAVKRD